MPPRAQTNVLRGRGRPKRSAASPAPAPVADAPKKRGRAAKAEAAQDAAAPLKKRGRPAKAPVEEPVKRTRRSLAAPEPAVVEEPAPKKRTGRPPKSHVAQVPAPAPAPAPKKRAGRPSQADVAAATAKETPAAPKRRGRPARNAASTVLGRVGGSPRVTKSRARSTPKVKTATAPRINPRMRSKLRTRLAPAQKAIETVPLQPAKRRGRPAKAAAQATSQKKPTNRKAPTAAVTKPVASRKKRGVTILDVPDKFAAQVRQYLQELQEAESLPALVQSGAADDIVAEAEIGADAGGDEELAVIVEENILITSATHSEDEENALVASEQTQDQDHDDADAVDDADADVGVQEEEIQDEVVQNIVILEDADVEEPTEAGPGIDIEMSIQEVVQIEHSSNDAGALEQDLDEYVETPEDDAASIFDNDTDTYIHEPVSRPSAGAIFG